MRGNVVTILTLVLLLPNPMIGQTTGNPLTGTWELDVARSTFAPAAQALKSQTRNYQVVGRQEKGFHKGIDAQGNPNQIEFIATYDGKDYPYKGSPDYNVVSLTLVDRFTTSFTQKRAGQVVLAGTRVVSKDGQMLTITAKGTDPKGELIDNVMVFVKR